MRYSHSFLRRSLLQIEKKSTTHFGDARRSTSSIRLPFGKSTSYYGNTRLLMRRVLRVARSLILPEHAFRLRAPKTSYSQHSGGQRPVHPNDTSAMPPGLFACKVLISTSNTLRNGLLC